MRYIHNHLLDPEKKSTLTLFTLSILYYFFQFLFTTYLTHHLKPAEYGNFYLAISFLAITAQLALLGTQTISVKFLPRYLSLTDSTMLQNFLSWVFKIVAVSFITCLMLSLLLATILFFFHALGIKHLDTYDLLIFILWITPFAAFALLLQNFILSNNHPIIYYLLQNDFTYLMQLALFIMAISVFHFQLTNLVFSLILIFTYTILIIIGLYFRDERKKRLFSYFIENLIIRHHLVCPDWKKMSYKVILSGVLFTIMSSLDLFILKLITPNKNLVGMYSVVWVICRIFSLIGYGIYTIIIPQIDMYTKPNSICSLQTFQKLLNKINKLMLIILIILALISITFGKEILALFSPEYAAVYVVLVICTITSFLTAVSIPAINLLLYSNHINTLMAIEALYLVLMLILGVVLTYYFSIIGISVACLITQSVVTLFQIHYVRKKTHIKSMIII